MRKTKIVCTIGPACDSKEMMRKMIDAGMNVARINMSHGVYDRLEVTIKNLKEAIAESGQNVAILLDTKGPEVRVGTFKDGSVELVEGAEFSLFKNKEEVYLRELMEKKIVLSLACLLIGIGLAIAQTPKTVTGLVIFEEDNQPIVGASVLIRYNAGAVQYLIVSLHLLMCRVRQKY